MKYNLYVQNGVYEACTKTGVVGLQPPRKKNKKARFSKHDIKSLHDLPTLQSKSDSEIGWRQVQWNSEK